MTSPIRFPRPPRTPSLGVGAVGAVSGTQRVQAPQASDEGVFPAEEPSSFDTRRTPVVPAQWPERAGDERATLPAPSPEPAPSAEVKITVAERQEGDVGDPGFFEAPPKYSAPPEVLVSEPPRPRPSPLRWMLTRLLFGLVLCAIATLACYELTIAFHLPWLDPRLLLGRLRLA